MEFYGLACGEGVFFGEEGSTEGGFAVVIELLVGEASEDGSLTDS